MTAPTRLDDALRRLEAAPPALLAGLRSAFEVADDAGCFEREALLRRLADAPADDHHGTVQEMMASGLITERRPDGTGDELTLASEILCTDSAARRALLDVIETRLRTMTDDPLSSTDSEMIDDRGPFAAIQTDEQSTIVPGGSTLTASGLVKVYRKRRVVNEVEVQVSQGEIVGLLGPNGAGKTTTFYMMVGLIAPDAGKVGMDGDDLTRVPMFRRARRGIGYLAQEPSVFRKLTVEENVLAILQMMKLSRREQRERLELLLDELGIKHLRKTKAYALSGGERRRLEITRALVGEPKFMLLDEPFAGVDPIAVHDIQEIVSDLRGRGIGVLISDHNVEQTLDIVDRAYIMYDGRVRVAGTVSELVWNDEVAEIYLGPTLTARMRQRYPHPG
jgi:lipopolysaccharide export system ATP-binding protein